MRAEARALAIEVNKAFADVRYPLHDPIYQAPENDEGTAEYFRGRNWRDVDRSDLMRRRFALVAFTPAAFAYFLPTYLLACLESDHAPLDSLLPALTPPKNNPKRPSYWAWWSLLSSNQRRVVIQCLRYWDRAESGLLSMAATSLEATVDA